MEVCPRCWNGDQISSPNDTNFIWSKFLNFFCFMEEKLRVQKETHVPIMFGISFGPYKDRRNKLFFDKITWTINLVAHLNKEKLNMTNIHMYIL